MRLITTLHNLIKNKLFELITSAELITTFTKMVEKMNIKTSKNNGIYTVIITMRGHEFIACHIRKIEAFRIALADALDFVELELFGGVL